MRTGQAKLDELLLAVVERLQSAIPGANEATCFLTLDPDFIPPAVGDFTYAVGLLGGQFAEEYWDGGGQEQATIAGGFSVSIWSRMRRDQPGHDSHLLTDDSLGLLERWRLVVKSLTDPAAWEPTRDDDAILRDPIIPAGFRPKLSQHHMGAMEQDFKLSFDLDLS